MFLPLAVHTSARQKHPMLPFPTLALGTVEKTKFLIPVCKPLSRKVGVMRLEWWRFVIFSIIIDKTLELASKSSIILILRQKKYPI